MGLARHGTHSDAGIKPEYVLHYKSGLYCPARKCTSRGKNPLGRHVVRIVCHGLRPTSIAAVKSPCETNEKLNSVFSRYSPGSQGLSRLACSKSGIALSVSPRYVFNHPA